MPRLIDLRFYTGASSGIGAAAAEELARYGCKVALVARSKEKLDKVAEKLGKDNSLAIECDVSKPEVRTHSCSIYTLQHTSCIACILVMLETLLRTPQCWLRMWSAHSPSA